MSILKTSIAFFTILLTVSLSALQVFGISSAVSRVSLEIKPGLICKLNLIVHPEKRIPRTGNWGTLLTAYVYNGSQKIASAQARSDDQGLATFDFCVQNLTFVAGNYNIAVKGLSHLCKNFPNTYAFESDTQVVDLTTSGMLLFAGETSNVFDDKINSLDASTQIRYFYRTDDEKNDLNRDTKVNSLDFSNTVFNFYDLGDGLCN